MKTITAKEKLKREYEEKCLLIDEEELAKKLFPEANKIFVVNYQADYWITLPEVETLSEAMEIAEKNNPLSVFACRDSCLSFVPENYLDEYEEKNKNATCSVIGAYRYEVSQMSGYPIERKLTFYVTREGKTAKISVPVKNDPDTYIDTNITFNRQGSPVKHWCKIINNSGHFAKTVKFWSSDDHPNNFVLYN